MADADLLSAKYCVAYFRGSPTSTQIQGEIHAVDTLISMYRKHPKGIYLHDQTMRQVLVDRASALDSCDKSDARKLERVLRYG